MRIIQPYATSGAGGVCNVFLETESINETVTTKSADNDISESIVESVLVTSS